MNISKLFSVCALAFVATVGCKNNSTSQDTSLKSIASEEKASAIFAEDASIAKGPVHAPCVTSIYFESICMNNFVIDMFNRVGLVTHITESYDTESGMIGSFFEVKPVNKLSNSLDLFRVNIRSMGTLGIRPNVDSVTIKNSSGDKVIVDGDKINHYGRKGEIKLLFANKKALVMFEDGVQLEVAELVHSTQVLSSNEIDVSKFVTDPSFSKIQDDWGWCLREYTGYQWVYSSKSGCSVEQSKVQVNNLTNGKVALRFSTRPSQCIALNKESIDGGALELVDCNEKSNNYIKEFSIDKVKKSITTDYNGVRYHIYEGGAYMWFGSWAYVYATKTDIRSARYYVYNFIN